MVNKRTCFCGVYILIGDKSYRKKLKIGREEGSRGLGVRRGDGST